MKPNSDSQSSKERPAGLPPPPLQTPQDRVYKKRPRTLSWKRLIARVMPYSILHPDRIENPTAAQHESIEEEVCDRCLGRRFYRPSRFSDNETQASREQSRNVTISNIERGKLHRTKKYLGYCIVCLNIFPIMQKMIQDYRSEILEYEAKTFIVSCNNSKFWGRREQDWCKYTHPILRDTLPREIRREFGKEIERTTPLTVDFDNPHITVEIDIVSQTIRINPAPEYYEGRYTKNSRNEYQSDIQCDVCHGEKSCERCQHTIDSVGSMIGIPIQEMSEGTSYKFHAAGREDRDVRCLSPGRPFVVEIMRPKRRNLDPITLTQGVNHRSMRKYGNEGPQTTILIPSTRKRVRFVKQHRFKKTYVCNAEFQSRISEQELRGVIQTLTSRTIEQKTPLRVLRRRVDMIRKRQVLNMTCDLTNNGLGVSCKLETEAGLYIKELFHGDEGRTIPSVHSLLHPTQKVTVTSLDVVGIEE